MKHSTRLIAILAFFSLFTSNLKAQDMEASKGGQPFSQDVIVNFVKDYLKEKAKYTGNVDLYDEKINKVRNLKLLEIKDKLDQEGDHYSIQGEFRDVSSGDVASVKMNVISKEGKLEMGSLDVENVEKSALIQSIDPNRQFTDEEVQDSMTKYFLQKSKFTGTFDMFDEKVQKMRNLQIGNFQGKIRRFGSRFIGRVEAVDQASNENLELDVSVDNKQGILEVNSVKIFSVNKVQR